MSVWFKQVTVVQFNQLDTWFWWREYGTCLWLYIWRVLRDVFNEWYDIRNWFMLLMLPLAVVLSPLSMLNSMRQAKMDRERFGLTLHNQRNIEWLRAKQSEDNE